MMRIHRTGEQELLTEAREFLWIESCGDRVSGMEENAVRIYLHRRVAPARLKRDRTVRLNGRHVPPGQSIQPATAGAMPKFQPLLFLGLKNGARRR